MQSNPQIGSPILYMCVFAPHTKRKIEFFENTELGIGIRF